MSKSLILILLQSATVFLLVPNIARSSEPSREAVTYVRTIDGDSFACLDSDGSELLVKLFNIDSPELTEGSPAAFEAALTLAVFLSNAESIFIERDAVYPKDSLDRILAWVWIGRDNPILVNSLMLLSGHVEISKENASEKHDIGALADQERARTALSRVVPPLERLADRLTPPPAPSADKLFVSEFSYRWEDYSKAHNRCVWKARIDNDTGQKQWVNIHFELGDQDNFELASGTIYHRLLQIGTNELSGDFFVETYLKDQVTGSRCRISWLPQ